MSLWGLRSETQTEKCLTKSTIVPKVRLWLNCCGQINCFSKNQSIHELLSKHSVGWLDWKSRAGTSFRLSPEAGFELLQAEPCSFKACSGLCSDYLMFRD